MKENFSNTTDQEVMKFYADVSNKIKQLRTEANMTQLDLSLEIGIKSVAFYSNCENNRYGKHFNLEHIYKITKVFNMPLSFFFNTIS
ncbi:helix-turn-helix transcriptional regulator [Sulfurospirillum oryzae]|uniref:helix-turn-helix transcriptional regulator n=1 Tax=Sulfurospirillum oryzae TaxID=2976535 RepID=UPI0021E8601C|nr:helix-turn-helix transcriptional regulator [Sulfurospirillum oryzae]